jgi:hypothetical protein
LLFSRLVTFGTPVAADDLQKKKKKKERKDGTVMTLTLQQNITNEDVLEAISLKCSTCYGAMSIANRVGGTPTVAWQLCHTYPLAQIIQEAQERGLALDSVRVAVGDELVQDSMYWKLAMKLVTEEEFQKLFRQRQTGK